jgi:polar amino acid transport system substrate-binding protein
MAQEGVTPPEAVRGGVSRGVFVGTVIVVAVLMFLAGLALAPFFAPPGVAGPAVLVIGTNTPFPPFEFRDENDNIVGFDIALITEVMNRIGEDFEIFDFRDFSALLSAVQEGRVDVAASAITSSGDVGAARNETMDFSDSYYEADQSVLVRSDETRVQCSPDPAGCQPGELEDFRIATQSGTTSEFWVLDFLPGADMTTFPDVTQVLQALQSASVDIVIIDKPAGDGIAAQNPEFKVAGTIQTNELYAFAVADGDPLGLIPRINAALAAMRTDGTYDSIVAEWFG